MLLEKHRFVKNAASNLVSGMSSALLGLVLPYFFVRHLPPAEFAIWVLALQLAAYISYLNFGFQTAIGRFVAFSMARADREHAEDIISAGLQLLSLLGLLGFAGIALLSWKLGDIFHQLPRAQLPEARVALLWIGGATALSLPSSAFLGALVGLERNEIPALTALAGRTVLATILILAAHNGSRLTTIAALYFAGNAMQYFLQFLAFRKFCKEWEIRIFRWKGMASRELIRFCAGLSLWSVGMLLINGMDTTIVGIFDFRDLAPYGLALGAATFFAGAVQAISTPLIQIFARQHAQENHSLLVAKLENASVISSILLFLSGSWLLCVSDILLPFWVGTSLAREVAPIFTILVIANAIRYTTSPFAHYVISSGQQSKVVLSPLLEGITNCIASVGLAAMAGGIGVAVGTLVGVLVGAGCHFWYSMPRTIPEFQDTRAFRKIWIEPFICTMPVIFLVLCQKMFAAPAIWIVPLGLLASLPAALRLKAIRNKMVSPDGVEPSAL